MQMVNMRRSIRGNIFTDHDLRRTGKSDYAGFRQGFAAVVPEHLYDATIGRE